MDKQLRTLRNRYKSGESVFEVMPGKKLMGNLKTQFEKATKSLTALFEMTGID